MNHKISWAFRHPVYAALKVLSRVYNMLIVRSSPRNICSKELSALQEIESHARHRSNISDHLVALLAETLRAKPRLIVELGVGAGGSNFVFLRAAKLCGARLVSVDIEDYAHLSEDQDWLFVRRDDVTFAREFPDWCRQHGLQPQIDLLFIDTNHLYDQAMAEIEAWFPLLAEEATVMFHDTNVRMVYFRRDGSMGVAVATQREVMRALETYLGRTYDETADFTDFRKGWLIQHTARCCGFTVMRRSPDFPKG